MPQLGTYRSVRGVPGNRHQTLAFETVIAACAVDGSWLGTTIWQEDLFETHQPACLPVPFARYLAPYPDIDRAVVGPFRLRINAASHHRQHGVIAFVGSRNARAVLPLRIYPWDADMPLPWPAILEAVATGVGSDGIEVMGGATMDDVLSPSFWEADAQSANEALWRWIDVALDHIGATKEGGEPCSPHVALDCLWRAVDADIRWVLEAMPDELRSVHARLGDAPFWLTRGLFDHAHARSAGITERTYLQRFIVTAPLPLLRLAITDSTGEALLDTIGEGRSLTEFLKGWLDVPRHIWRMVLREAATLPDMAPEDFAEALQALRVIPRNQWPTSRSAWLDLVGLATALAYDREALDADPQHQDAILRTLWQQSPECGSIAYRQLRGASELLFRFAEDQGVGQRGASRAETMLRMLNAGKRRPGTAGGPPDARPLEPICIAPTMFQAEAGASLSFLTTVADVSRAGRQFSNCLRSMVAAKNHLRGGTLLAVVSLDGAPAAMIALAATARRAGSEICLERLKVHGHANSDVGAPMRRRIEALVAALGQRFGARVRR